MVRRADPDRYLAALFAPADKRGHLLALYAFNVEIARVADTVREPMMGEIRLEWWRETLGRRAPGHAAQPSVARALDRAVRRDRSAADAVRGDDRCARLRLVRRTVR